MNGNTITVTRAQAGTTPVLHDDGVVIYALSEDMKLNLPIGLSPSKSASSKMVLVRSQLQSALGEYNVTLVPMPVLFGVNPDIGPGLMAKSSNIVNCLNNGNGKIHTPFTGCLKFEQYILNELPTRVMHNVWTLHCASGEIHCATAVERSMPFQPLWWKKIVNWE